VALDFSFQISLLISDFLQLFSNLINNAVKIFHEN